MTSDSIPGELFSLSAGLNLFNIITELSSFQFPKLSTRRYAPGQRWLTFKLAGVYRSPRHSAEPAFTYLDGNILKTLAYSTFTSKLKETLDKCGFNSSHFSGHSFWRGGATFALHCCIPCDYIKLQGDWKSNAYERYLDRSLLYKQEPVKQMCEGITH